MKYFLTGLAVLMMVTTANAKPNAMQIREYCSDISSIAHSYMGIRQYGMSINKAIKRIDEDLVDGSAQQDMLHAILIDAFSRPAYQTEKYRKEAMVNFESEYYVACAASLLN